MLIQGASKSSRRAVTELFHANALCVGGDPVSNDLSSSAEAAEDGVQRQNSNVQSNKQTIKFVTGEDLHVRLIISCKRRVRVLPEHERDSIYVAKQWG